MSRATVDDGDELLVAVIDHVYWRADANGREQRWVRGQRVRRRDLPRDYDRNLWLPFDYDDRQYSEALARLRELGHLGS